MGATQSKGISIGQRLMEISRDFSEAPREAKNIRKLLMQLDTIAEDLEEHREDVIIDDQEVSVAQVKTEIKRTRGILRNVLRELLETPETPAEMSDRVRDFILREKEVIEDQLTDNLYRVSGSAFELRGESGSGLSMLYYKNRPVKIGKTTRGFGDVFVCDIDHIIRADWQPVLLDGVLKYDASSYYFILNNTGEYILCNSEGKLLELGEHGEDPRTQSQKNYKYKGETNQGEEGEVRGVIPGILKNVQETVSGALASVRSAVVEEEVLEEGFIRVRGAAFEKISFGDGLYALRYNGAMLNIDIGGRSRPNLDHTIFYSSVDSVIRVGWYAVLSGGEELTYDPGNWYYMQKSPSGSRYELVTEARESFSIADRQENPGNTSDSEAKFPILSMLRETASNAGRSLAQATTAISDTVSDAADQARRLMASGEPDEVEVKDGLKKVLGATFERRRGLDQGIYFLYYGGSQLEIDFGGGLRRSDVFCCDVDDVFRVDWHPLIASGNKITYDALSWYYLKDLGNKWVLVDSKGGRLGTGPQEFPHRDGNGQLILDDVRVAVEAVTGPVAEGMSSIIDNVRERMTSAAESAKDVYYNRSEKETKNGLMHVSASMLEVVPVGRSREYACLKYRASYVQSGHDVEGRPEVYLRLADNSLVAGDMRPLLSGGSELKYDKSALYWLKETDYGHHWILTDDAGNRFNK